MNTRFKVFASYNILQHLCDFIHVLIFVTVSKCRKCPRLANIVIYALHIIFHILHGYWFARFELPPSRNIALPSLSTRQKEAPLVGSNLVSCKVVCTAWFENCHQTCKTKILSLHVSNQMVSSTHRYYFKNALKFGTFSIIGWMTRTLSKSTYDFITSGIVAKFSSCNFMLHCPKDASISSCMWPTNGKKNYKHLLVNAFCNQQRAIIGKHTYFI